jgi:hypothetical protein
MCGKGTLVLSEETKPVGHAMAKKAEGQEDQKKADTMQL